MKKLLAMFAILGMVVLGCEGLSSGEKAGVGEPTGKAAPPPEKKATPAPEKEASPPEEKSTPPAPESSELTDKKSKLGYSVGFNVGHGLKIQLQGTEIDTEVLLRGMSDAFSGAEPALDRKEIIEAVKAVEEEIKERRAEAREQQMKQAAEQKMKLGEKNKKDGAAFLAENAKKDGVKTVESGLQYRVIKAGNGLSPKKTDKVIVHYRGTRIDGTEFDSSIKRGEPTTFDVGGVIPGFSEALQMMKVGAKWEVFVPGELAYGERNAFATLIFELELIGIEPPAAPE
ncbi:MAG: FKBP-type peptidyl-prolyl cis-trans isomerase [Planctomycetes bacterium]|nr:FKBP-type peptidyl-prolyl cis-trans isomerase [Planctomycetota bacterium]